MRKFISLICLFIFVCSRTEAQIQSVNSCQSFLLDNVLADSASTTVSLENPISADNLNNGAESLENLGYPKLLVDTLLKVRQLMDKSRSLKFISKSKYDHLLEDLEELSKELNKKSNNESFMEMIKKWYDFSLLLEKQIQAFEDLEQGQQRLYFQKMKLPISFMTSHFITFLETKHLKFSYQRMYTILKSILEKDLDKDLILFLYQFETQVLKFFSKVEFIDCQA